MNRLIQRREFLRLARLIPGRARKQRLLSANSLIGVAPSCHCYGQWFFGFIRCLSVHWLGRGDELITTPRTFIATATSAVLLGAKPIFADVDPNSGSITAATIAPLITSRTKAIAVVHLGGWPADMPEICDLANSHGISVIEDCAQAHGARINSQSVGNFGDVSAWSFCQDKIMSTGGEGGMVNTSRPELWDVMWSFKDHGKTQQALSAQQHSPGFRWLHERFGSNSASQSFNPQSVVFSSSACRSGPLSVLVMLRCLQML